MSNLKNKKKINWTRVLCLILAFIMIAGMGTLAVTIIISEISAAEIVYEKSDYTFSSETDGDTYIAVGLMYGSSITVGFEIKAPYGFVAGKTVITKDVRSFEPFYYVDSNIASVTLDDNLSKKSMTYSVTGDPEKTVIGGYHVELKHEQSAVPLEYLVEDVSKQLNEDGVYPIPAFINGRNAIRLGHFATEDEARALLQKLENSFEGYEIGIASPSKTAVSVVNPETDVILFEYDSSESSDSIGFIAYQADEYDSFIQTPANNLYEGVMTFIPRYTEDYSGVALTNVLDLESYVEGVLPYEISNSWSREVLRTFAITIRSYAIANYCKWYSRYGFDMTATTSDQVYKGRNKVNDAVVEAVTSTEGLVTVYDGKVISAYYSSSVGGSTVGSQYVWGSERGYLTTVYTPWERYADYNNGLWYTEVTPEALCSTLRSRGYTDLNGAIASIEVETVENNSDYVYALTVTDTSGHTVKINRSDAVRTTLSTYLKSANFTVGKGSLERTYDKVHDIKVVGGSGTVKPPVAPEKTVVVKGYVTNDPLLISDVMVLDDSGEVMTSEYPVAYVLTSTGRKISMNSCVATADNYEDVTPFEYDNEKVTLLDPEDIPDDFDEYPETSFEVETEESEETETETEFTVTTTPSDFGENAYDVTSDYENVSIITTVETITETLTASSENNFIFAGKGWGHGVGISQYGAKDLSDAGASAEDIISIYFTGVDIIHRSQLPYEEEPAAEEEADITE